MKAQSKLFSFPPNIAALYGYQNVATKESNQDLNFDHKYRHPLINKEAHKATLDNYRAYIEHYNSELIKINAAIKNDNAVVATNRKNNPPDSGKKHLLDLFTKKYGHLKGHKYNQAAREFNDVHGHYIKQRPLIKVKPLSLQVFEAILHAFTVQLQQYVKVYKKIGKTVPTTLPMIRLNHAEIVTQQRNGHINLDLCSRTIRNHRQRLYEAGVLVDYEYRGTKRPVNITINPEILVVLEGFQPKTQNAKNQSLKVENRKELPNIKVPTGTFTKELEIKGNVDKQHPDIRNVAAQLGLNILFYKNTKSQGEKTEKPAAQKKSKPAAKNSTIRTWLSQIDSPFNLARRLSLGEFDYYTPIDQKKLVAHLGSPELSDNDFRDIVVQDFVKSAARLWKDNQGSAQSWYRAIEFIQNNQALNNFTGNASTKIKIYGWLMEHRYRLRWAMGWFKKQEWSGVIYPNLYFDPLRELPNQVSFAFTKKVWKQRNQKKLALAAKRKREALKNKRAKEALSAQRQDLKRLDAAIKRYFDKIYSLEDLIQYCIKDLPKINFDQVFNRLETLNTKRLEQ